MDKIVGRYVKSTDNFIQNADARQVMIVIKCVNSTGKDELANGSWGSCEVFHLSENMVMWKVMCKLTLG